MLSTAKLFRSNVIMLTYLLLFIGSLFDESGNMRSIWDATTRNRFDEREQCFVDQYNKYCDLGFCVSNLLDIQILCLGNTKNLKGMQFYS